MIKVLNESGFKESLLGLGLNKNIISIEDYWHTKKKFRLEDIDKNFEYWDKTFGRMYRTACKLAGKGNGHDKFLESINVQMYIEAPRYIWQEFDTYRVGITKQSESTMNSLKKNGIDTNMFEGMELEENNEDMYMIIEALNRIHSRGNLHDIKVALPEGFIQGRVVSTNYKTIQNIYRQRKNHKMKWWRINLIDLLRQLEYPEFITK